MFRTMGNKEIVGHLSRHISSVQNLRLEDNFYKLLLLVIPCGIRTIAGKIAWEAVLHEGFIIT